ncbi:hypothetical protein A3740_01815 [Oleiphilus sp. HI0068]|nr:hypothetical protein A3740_01815 [Oleiphilus sp. HI0068]KZY77893.1 hypothetical protein A3741_01455 [Oleiphilus sp. HI0069]
MSASNVAKTLEQQEHAFDGAVNLKGDPNCLVGQVSADYQNMVGPFGGVTAATILQAVLGHPEREGMPVSLTINYMGPIEDDELVVKPALLRTNRSNQHWRVDFLQGDVMQCSASCVFAKRNETWSNDEVRMPYAPDFEEVDSLPKFPGMPSWVDQYDMRFVYGAPFQPLVKGKQATPSESLLWISDKPARKLDYASVTAISDSFFPRIFVRRHKIVPMGTVSLTINFHITEDELLGLEATHLLGRASATKFTNGYFEQRAELWSPDGTLVATSSQMVYYKD